MRILKLLSILILSAFITVNAFAESFTVQQIDIYGLKGISRDTVLNYVPVKPGQKFDTSQSGEVIRKLYATGFFENISINRSGNRLIIDVTERSIIGSITVIGNDSLPEDKLNLLLKDYGLVKGREFKPAALVSVKQILEEQYQRQGKSKATVTTDIKQEDRNRLAITIFIDEGKSTKVGEIQFIGNKAFSTSTLKKQLEIKTSSLLTFITHKDELTQDKLDESLTSLAHFYQDHGYVRFKVLGTETKPIPKKKKVLLIIRVEEGQQYIVQGYELRGTLILSEAEIRKKIVVQPGKLYNYQDVKKSVDAITKALGDQGYGFANVLVEPIINDATKKVVIAFNVDPGSKLYIRKITFSGNVKTSDVVLRREMRQDEGALYSSSKIEESERQLRILNYFESVDVKTKPVAGTNDQVDLDVNVTELPGAEAIAAVGYGTEGPVFDLSLNQNNFLGTGNQVGVALKRSQVTTAGSFTYFNPYYTPEGIGRGFDIFYQRSNLSHVDVAHYTTEQYGAMINYIFPLSDIYKLRTSFGFNSLKIFELGSNTSTQIQEFVNAEGTEFKELRGTIAWISNSYDKMPFPTKGMRQELGVTLNLPAASDGISYYRSYYNNHWYLPLNDDFIFNTRGSLGYGNHLFGTANYPFYENYFAGGLVDQGMVRGYQNYSLGPFDSRDRPLGGNTLVNGSLGLIFPNFISRDKLRTEVFVDAGNVYDWGGTKFKGTDAGPLRFSTGLGVSWYSPLGPIMFSLATPLNKQKHDDTRIFDFIISIPF